MKYINLTALIILIIIAACGNPEDIGSPGTNLTGYVTHINMNLIPGGFYSVSVYSADSTDPFHRVPVRTDSLNLKQRDQLYETVYDMNGIQQGRYYVAATWSQYPRIPNEIPMVLGIYGCDTSMTCTAYTEIPYPNYQSLFRNIISWTDAAHRMN